jgi:hypothetical protein
MFDCRACGALTSDFSTSEIERKRFRCRACLRADRGRRSVESRALLALHKRLRSEPPEIRRCWRQLRGREAADCPVRAIFARDVPQRFDGRLRVVPVDPTRPFVPTNARVAVIVPQRRRKG